MEKEIKIIGNKFYGHDSALFCMDPKNKIIFSISTERITRIKHDVGTIEPILQNYKNFFNGYQYIIYPNVKSRISNLISIYVEMLFRLLYNKNLTSISNYKKIKQHVFKTYFLKSKFLINCFVNFPNKTKDLVKYLFLKKFKEYDYNYVNKELIILFNNIFKRYFPNFKKEYSFYEHHLCHAASAYYFSPFNEMKSLVFTLDGWGDFKCQTLYYFDKKNYKELSYTLAFKLDNKNDGVSIGNIYSKFTEILGFTPNSDEGKVEALAAYGKCNEELYNLLKKGFPINKEKLKWEYNYDVLLKLYNVNFLKKWQKKIGDKDMAATIQKWLEDTVIKYLNLVYEKYKIPRLCLAGGVTANVIMNLNIYERTPFKNLYIFPAMGDDGTAAGAAILKAIELGYDVSWLKDEYMPYWGPSVTKEEVKEELKKGRWKEKIKFKYIGDNWPELAAKYVYEKKIIALFHGKMEFGPRALGNRSIIANPLDPNTRDKINSTVKRRPYFQPFCPSVLEEDRERLFEKSYNHKHMAIAFRVKKEYWDKLPSGMHIDGTARPQFVEEKDNPNYYKLIKEFKRLSGYGMVINTSFNLHGRTIVRTPYDAVRDFIDCNIDALFIEGYLVERKS
jgi:carbamoyltransferase